MKEKFKIVNFEKEAIVYEFANEAIAKYGYEAVKFYGEKAASKAEKFVEIYAAIAA